MICTSTYTFDFILGLIRISFQMAPGKNKSGSGGGLKILWIPGRKKHHDKGIYKPTNYNVEHKHAEKKIENWALGGSKTQNDIIAGR